MAKITLPNTQVKTFYEGSDPQQYTRLTGPNLNNAPVQLLANEQFLLKYVNAIVGMADSYSSATTYGIGDVVKGPDGNLYASLINANVGKPVTDDSAWQVLVIAVNDGEASTSTPWSSQRTQDEIMAMVIALG